MADAADPCETARRGADKELASFSDGEADFQAGLWRVLAKQVSLYTLGESSSLPEYDAHRLLASACFVLGVDPDDPDPVLMRAIVAEGAEEAFEREVRLVEREAERTDDLWREVAFTTPLLESVALKDTLESLRGFRSRYAPRFFAHEIPADIDYPLAAPVPETVQGVRYVNTYLGRLLLENRFLQRFELERCKGVLRAVHPGYGELILNLFEPVATNAVGCALAGCDVRGLRVDDAGYERIAASLRGKSARQVRVALENAAARACDEAGLRPSDDEPVRGYVERLASGLTPQVRNALAHDALTGVFVR
ncbi:hypothetical protein C1878_11545 [Gordonibacter sp. 28C]|uniref:DUF6179 domain-containing protein n=1 Tax=Gordonibacter sp. 28C TaxID=2078569 RepID=UPI000DF7F7C9|nr:DUF6179 domain-containing protein [Gordonibacter sp. 28C]RDB61346.1 hypothetical protein C1878_11545 [Gordonibacter sp. 28C]